MKNIPIKITFNNKPKLYEHQSNLDFNERRLNLISHIESFISNHSLFKNKKVGVTFFEKGVSSLVCLLETSDDKLVLKIALSKTYGEGEGMFLKIWEQVGVKVPHIIEEGFLGGQSYTLMEYIETPTLEEMYTPEELVKKEIPIEMGRVLRKMHKPEATGYGLVVNGKAEYSTFKKWIEGNDVQKRIDYMEEYKILDEKHGSIQKAIEILLKYIEKNKKSSYCHYDFGVSNIFGTNPITIFDPGPRFNNGYLDLGRSVLMSIANDKLVEANQMIDGYFEKETYDIKVLHASILLNGYMKLYYAHKKNRLEIVKNIQGYLIKNKHLLEN